MNKDRYVPQPESHDDNGEEIHASGLPTRVIKERLAALAHYYNTIEIATDANGRSPDCDYEDDIDPDDLQ